MSITLKSYPELPTFDVAGIKQHAKEEFEWPHEKIDRAVQAYLRFLALHKAYPNETMCPTPDIDLIWHLHILDTRGYARDCYRFLGRFLDHDPYIDHGLRESVKATTRRLWMELFGELPEGFERLP